MESLSERFEVRLPPHTLETLRRESQKRNVPMSQLVREAIDMLLEQDQQAKMRAADELFSIGAPVADWEQMKDEITASHLKDATDG
jgi:Arc/MetJ-type ribon-helix-helix transcriptional regulator